MTDLLPLPVRTSAIPKIHDNAKAPGARTRGRYLSLLFAALICSLAVEARAQLPPNFVDENVVSGLNQSVSFGFLPDGRMLILQKGGAIIIADPNQGWAKATYMTITNIESGNERGLLDITLDPNFSSNGYFYVYYSPASPAGFRISRFTHQQNQGGLTSRGSLGSEFVVWTEKWPGVINPGVGVYSPCCHYGAGLDFGPDGKLWLTPGDKFNGVYAQDRASSAGSIIRVNKDGSVPNGTDGWPANPYANNTNGWDKYIWAYGLRNPFRARWDIPTGRYFVGEVGGNDQTRSWEDLHLAKLSPAYAGLDYGWPRCEGRAPYTDFPTCDIAGTLAEPIYAYDHAAATPDGGSITGGFVYRGSTFPVEYQGAYFFGDYALRYIRYLKFSPSDNTVVTGNFNFQPSAGSIVALEQGSDGSLYYLQISGAVRRIVYNGISVSATANPTSGIAPLTVNFNGSAGAGSGSVSYKWIFGDGTSSPGLSNPATSHTYTSNGTYVAQLEATVGGQTARSEPITIQVGAPPQASILSPSDGALFRAGDVINFSGTASGGGGGIGTNGYSWRIRFGHNDHYHPVLDGYIGQNGSLSIPTSGHDYSDNTRYELELTVTDQQGLSDTDVINIYPDKVDVSYGSVPSGIPITVDDIARTPPFVIDELKGFQRIISVPATACKNGVLYQFSNWSDGGARQHTIVVPNTNVTFTATFTAGGSCDALPVTAGLVLALESDVGVVANASNVTGWQDQSGKGNHLAAAGDPELLGSSTPTGLPAIALDGTGDEMFRSSATGQITGLPTANGNRTLFAVARYRSAGVWAGVAYGQGAQNRAFGLVVNGGLGKLALQGWGTANDLVSSANGTGAGWIVQSAKLSGGVGTLYKDGAVIASWNHSYNTLVEKITIGREIKNLGYADMDIAAVLLYDRALTDAERQQVDSYLQDKYVGGNTAPVPTIAITSPANGATVGGPDVAVTWSATSVATGDHVHLTLDTSTPVTINQLQGTHTFTGVTAGAHTIKAEVARADHVVYTNPEASKQVSITVSGGGPSEVITPAQAIKLFNGSNLNGLYPWFASSGFSDPKQIFKVQNGLIHVNGDEWGALTTNAAYKDYIMVLEFKWGTKTWGPRAGKAKDAGIIFHSNGSEGGWDNLLMPGVQLQIMQGGMGDFILLDNPAGSMAFTSKTEQVTCTFSTWNCRGGYRWKSSGTTRLFDQDVASQHWAQWDPDWQDVYGFRGDNDIESPDGEWNQFVLIAQGSTAQIYFNGVKVNEATNVTPTSGKIQLEAEFAEHFVRRWELLPLGAHVGPMIVSTSLANGQIGVPYTDKVDAVAMGTPLTYSVSSGTLPTGLTLNPSTGVLSGTPTAQNSFSFTIKVTDAQGASATSPYSVTIGGAVGPGLITNGLVLQLESDLNVVTNGTTVGGWLDQSGWGNDLSAAGNPQLVPGVTPSGKPAVGFDGAGDKLERTATLNGLPGGSSNRTMFMVARYSSNGFGGVAYGSTSCGQTFGLTVDTNGKLAVQRWCNDYTTSSAGTGAGWLVQSALLSGTTLTHYKNGTQIATTTGASFNTALNRLVLGAEIDSSPFLEMDVAAVVLYNRALSGAERQQVEQYLQEKYLVGSGGNTPPVIASVADKSVLEGQTLNVAVSATDADQDPITLSATLLNLATGTPVIPGSYTFTDNGDGTGTFSWKPAQGTAGSYRVTVTATDGVTPATKSFNVTVTAPAGVASVTITSPADGAAQTGSSIAVQWSATGSQTGDHVHLRLAGSPLRDNKPLNGTDTFSGLSPGSHVIIAEVASAGHVVYPGAADTATVTLTGASADLPVTAGLVLRLESDRDLQSTGSTVTGWLDQSGRGNNLSVAGNPQLLASGTPAGRPAISLDGVDDELRRLSTSGISGLPAAGANRTLITVARFKSATAWAGIAYGKGQTNGAFGIVVNGSAGKLTLQGWGTGQDLVSNVAAIGAGWQVQSGVVNGATAELFKDGTSVAAWNHTYNTVVEQIAIGREIKSLGYAGLDVAAVLLYDRALSAAERNQVEQYLRDKFLTGTLAKAATLEGDAVDGMVASELSPAALNDELPEAFVFRHVYPNPAATHASIAFDLPGSADIALEVYDVLGRQVIADEIRGLPAGNDRRINLDTGRLGSGVYLFRLVARMESETIIQSGKLTVIH